MLCAVDRNLKRLAVAAGVAYVLLCIAGGAISVRYFLSIGRPDLLHDWLIGGAAFFVVMSSVAAYIRFRA
jgi:hypothetical protein